MTAFVIMVARAFWAMVQDPCKLTYDSYDYIDFDTVSMFQGKLSNGRPPLYGMFLDLMGALFGENYLTATVWIQMTVSLVSLLFFAAMLQKVGISAPWAQFCVLFYGASPAITGWESCILTESFSLSMTVMFFYHVVCYLREHRLRNGAMAIFWTMLLVFLRPQFLTYLALLAVFFCLKLFFPDTQKERRTVTVLLAIEAIGIGCVLLYCLNFQRQFGIFSLTYASPRQNMMTSIWREYYKDFDDPELLQDIQSGLKQGEDAWNIVLVLEEKYGGARMQAVAKDYFSTHMGQYLRDTAIAMINDTTTFFNGYALNADSLKENVRGIFSGIYAVQVGLFRMVTVVQVLVVSLIEGCVMVIAWVRQRKMPWLHMALFSITFCTAYLTYIVTCGEYMRTMVSVLPYFYCMVAMFLQYCAEKSMKKQT